MDNRTRKIGYGTAMESFEKMRQAFEIAEGETECEVWSSFTMESTVLSPIWEHHNSFRRLELPEQIPELSQV